MLAIHYVLYTQYILLAITKYIIAFFLDCYINPAFTVIHFISKKLLFSFGLR